MTNEELRNALALLASQNAKLLAKPKRDAWDKFSVFVPLIAGLVITLTSLWITHRFEVVQKENETHRAEKERETAKDEKRRDEEKAAREHEWQQRISRTELLNKFIPYLAGDDRQASMAIVAISITGDAELMEAVSRMTPSRGVKEGLSQVAASGPSEEVRARASTTLNLLETLEHMKAPPDTPANRIRSRVVQIALDELKRGVREDPPGSNKGPDVDKYNKFAGMNQGTTWSGSFVCWCYGQALPTDKKFPVKLSPSTRFTMQELQRMQRWRPAGSAYKPQPGDLVLFQFSSAPAPSHEGIVIDVDNQSIYAIEGDTVTTLSNPPQGGVVAGKARPLSQVKGYGDMTFDNP